MKSRFTLLPLMAVTALSLSLAACDDKASEDAANQATVTEESQLVVEEPVLESAMPAAAVIEAAGATAYATAEGARTGAIFLTLTNIGTADDALLGASSDKATMTEIHESFVDEADGTMQMRKVSDVVVPAGGNLELKPGGYHVMLIDLLAPLVEGETFDITLQLKNAGAVVVPVTVTAPGSTADHSAHSVDETTTVTDEVIVEEEAPAETVEEVPADEPVLEETPATDESVAQ